MVSLVIVSHSLKLAQGLLELAGQVTQGKVNIAIAAGIDDPENPIGTDAVAVMEAIEAVYSVDGVLVMVDLGSAILSAETALDLIEPSLHKTVRICTAPIVEGCIAASVSAASGLPLEAVIQEANNALTAKTQALEQPLKPEEPKNNNAEVTASHHEPQTFIWKVHHTHGLHIRPAATLATTLRSFSAQIRLAKAGQSVDAKNINNLLSLNIQHNDTLIFTIVGEDAEQAVEVLKKLSTNNY
ncbi:dihydroxyacetone kinase phosphoryl donor subunit DhaM [Photobacterium alginatilyticum]|uniref:phosphoenolpyruvate--glycerone phosphotransferase n=1 Tax=Photobacterium alginatilyticum TaxID=1775171 RepID=A0ABW9YE90_9GAMM|nr:dihydroxyacetone kinase phosphoryl donor subunit DhaM [Photobacterium alginatilyticum]NBI51928.1 HPr family phosphocarrier protein [Photobacterium alginatilyticum]